MQFRIFVFIFFIFFSFKADLSTAIECYQCGQYTDGVGSITPCMNYTDAKHLKPCRDPKASCIKYVMGASVVMDCKTNCVEKSESWDSNTYCCETDKCNASSKSDISLLAAFLSASLLIFARFDPFIKI